MRSHAVAATLVFVLALGAGAEARRGAQTAQRPAPAPTALTFEAAMARALDANPTIAAARLRRAIALGAVGVARERPNPEFRTEFEKEAPKEAYGLAVPLELGNKRGNRIAVGEAAVKTGEAELAQVIVEVRAAVRRAYFGRAVAEARLALVGELHDMAVRARDAAQQRVEAGGVPRLEVVQAELALEQTDNEQLGAQAAADGARVTLNALLGFPLDTAMTLGSPLEEGLVPPPAAAIELARGSNAEIAVLDRRIEEQRARVALARSQQTPDVTPEATLTRRGEPEFETGWRAAVAVAVPIFTRHQAGVRVEQATLSQLDAERQATLTRIDGEVTAAATIAGAQQQSLQRYRDRILPQALEVERMAEDAYRLGQTGIAALLQALQATRDARLRSLEAADQFQESLATLERAIGATIR